MGRNARSAFKNIFDILLRHIHMYIHIHIYHMHISRYG